MGIVESLLPLAEAVDSIELLEGNPRVGDVEAVAASLERFGQRKPIVCRKADRVVIAGNHTLQAARQLGWSEIAVSWVDDDDATAMAFALADNRTAELGHYDDENLAAMIAAVRDVDEALLADTGWDTESVDELLAGLEPESPELEGDADDVPEPPPAKTVLGDVWLLGEHRVMCGDSTSSTDVERLMDGGKADMVWTDPPYGVAYESAGRRGKANQHREIANDAIAGDALTDFLRASLSEALSSTRLGAPWYVASPAGPAMLSFATVLSELGVWRHSITWVKDQMVFGRADFHYKHEQIFYGWTPGAAHTWEGDRKQVSVWEVARPKKSDLHPTMKPVELIAMAVNLSSRKNDVVLDLFGGSGSTLIAAHTTGRKARLMELDPRYVDVICRRYQELTGEKPVAESTGNPHDFTAE